MTNVGGSGDELRRRTSTLVEGSETVVMTLTASPAFKMGTASATVTISDND
jgi:hypothetical protein